MDDLSKIIEIRQHAIDGSPIPGDAARWLINRIDSYLAGDEVRLPSRYQILKARRDEHLRRAFDLLPDNLSEWRRCQVLSEVIRRFASRVWPRCRFDKQPPGRLTPAQAELWHAFKTGLPIPTTAQGISDIVRAK